MSFGWETAVRVAGPVIAAAAMGRWYYVGLAVIVAILVGTLIAAYRTWQEIHDVEEPATPADLLESFAQAHAEGELDATEFDRVRRLLASDKGHDAAPSSNSRPTLPAMPIDGPSIPTEDVEPGREARPSLE
jgi:hypothetical protein